MTFDLSSIDTIAACNKPFDLEIVHPATRAGTGVFLQLVGKDSTVYRDKIRAIANENIRRDALQSQRGKQDIQTIDRLEAKNIDALVAATTGWYTLTKVAVPMPEDAPDDYEQQYEVKRANNVTFGGVVYEFTPENVRNIYKAILPAREQALEAINDLENFMSV